MYTLSNWLMIGTHAEANQPGRLNQYDVGAVLQLANPTGQLTKPALYLRVQDATLILPRTLAEGVQFIRDQQAWGRRVLIVDDNARSCAPAFAIAALKELNGTTLIQSYRTLLGVHPHAQPHPLIWDSLCSYYRDEPPYDVLWFQIQMIVQEQMNRPAAH